MNDKKLLIEFLEYMKEHNLSNYNFMHNAIVNNFLESRDKQSPSKTIKIDCPHINNTNKLPWNAEHQAYWCPDCNKWID